MRSKNVHILAPRFTPQLVPGNSRVFKRIKTWFDAQIASTKDLTADIEATLSFESLRIYVFELEKLKVGYRLEKMEGVDTLCPIARNVGERVIA